MSRTEHKTGKIRKIEKLGLTLEELCKKIYNETSTAPFPEYYSSYCECLEDKDSHILVNDTLYEILENTEIAEEDDIARAYRVDDHTIEFEVRFYNGGASFTEMVKEAVKKMDNV